MARLLADHIRDGAGKPFSWGEADCCLFACDWVLARRGVDPMATWRGTYATRLGVYRRINKSGGFLAAVTLEMEAAGLMRTNDPQPGDVGVVQGPQGPVLAIRTPTGWACKAERGLIVAMFPFVRAWAV